ncbi:MAG: glycine cleavage system protein GcvH [Propionibacteriaceae bacterium]|nr:glycine cleavage system protein GcvH [Propionibacteriaceae bacterium]
MISTSRQEPLVSNYPEDLKYSADHEWVRGGNGSTVRVGITEYAAEQLGDIVYVSLPEVGDSVAAGDACGELESTKSVSDLFSPVPGVVSAVNELLTSTPEMINSDPYGDGWLFELDLAEDAELDGLMDADAYAEEVGS